MPTRWRGCTPGWTCGRTTEPHSADVVRARFRFGPARWLLLVKRPFANSPGGRRGGGGGYPPPPLPRPPHPPPPPPLPRPRTGGGWGGGGGWAGVVVDLFRR